LREAGAVEQLLELGSGHAAHPLPWFAPPQEHSQVPPRA
jgi:hypothetical protein